MQKQPRAIKEIGQEIQAKLANMPSKEGRKNSTSLGEYCRKYNKKKEDKGEEEGKIHKSLLSRLIKGPHPQKITPKVRDICRDLGIDTQIDVHELIALMERIPSAKRPHIRSILEKLFTMFEGENE